MNAQTAMAKRRARAARWVAGAGMIGLFVAASGVALGQDGTSCSQIATPAERLACYDRALPPAQPAPAESGGAASPPPAVAAPAEHSTSAAGAAPVAVSAAAAESEQLEAFPVVVVGMRKYPGRSATFTTDKGEVWIQIGGEGVYLPKVPFEAELRPASMGTYFLRPNDYGWRVHVRRDD
jgi:hypothetical protein